MSGERRHFWKIADNPLVDISMREVEAEQDEYYHWGWTIPECPVLLSEGDELFATEKAAVRALMECQYKRIMRANQEIEKAQQMLGRIADQHRAVLYGEAIEPGSSGSSTGGRDAG